VSGELLIYGASGYTAGLIIERAVAAGVKPILAGRSAATVAPVAARFGLAARVFALDEPQEAAAGLNGVGVVLNCAGPFSRTAVKLANACIRSGAHYLDITGEIAVFEAMAGLDAAARAAGVMLLPGSGFDVVPSDCLAAHLKRRLPAANRLTLAFRAIGRPSHGTATTMLENLGKGGCIRRGGRLTVVPPAWMTRRIVLGRRAVATIAVPWGDVSTAWYSTGIPDIEVFMAAPWILRFAARASRSLPGLLESPSVQGFFKRRIDAAPAGPGPDERRRGRSYLWGEAGDAAGNLVRATLETPEGYELTAMTAWDIAHRVATEGAAQAGFRTPSMLFGADYILGFAGCVRTDLPTDADTGFPGG
jgi:short subunit dehydrogenase-like uncharacterized protein